MNLNKQLFFVLSLLLLATQSLYSQEDKIGAKKKISIKAKTIPIKKTGSLDFDATKGFKNAYKNSQKTKTQAQKDADLRNKGIITPQMLAEQRLKEKFEKNNLKIPMIDKDLGSFHTKSKNINILSYDFGAIDGDIITIYINGIPVITEYTLDNTFKVFKIPLAIGFNRIDIVAVDEGEFRPNTGRFNIFDDFNATVSSDYWSLAKGAKVTAMIIREKE